MSTKSKTKNFATKKKMNKKQSQSKDRGQSEAEKLSQEKND